VVTATIRNESDADWQHVVNCGIVMTDCSLCVQAGCINAYVEYADEYKWAISDSAMCIFGASCSIVWDTGDDNMPPPCGDPITCAGGGFTCGAEDCNCASDGYDRYIWECN